MGVVELGHIVLYVRDLERSIAFYRDVLEWPMVEAAGHFPAAAFSMGHTHHDLLLIEVGADAQPIPEGRRVGMYHFGVKVGDTDDELRAMVAKLEAHPELTRITGFSDHGVTHSAYIVDPDGNEIELYIDVAGIDVHEAGVLTPPKPLRL